MKSITGRGNSGVVWVCIALLGLVAKAAAAEPNLVGWWKFNEGSGTIAYDSARSNNGTLNGNPNWIAGQIDGALQFDGLDDYVDLGNDASLNIEDSNFTISAWVNIFGWTGGGIPFSMKPALVPVKVFISLLLLQYRMVIYPFGSMVMTTAPHKQFL